MPHARFVPLRNFSAFTMLEGAIEPKDLAALAAKAGFPAAGLCDRNGLYAAPQYSGACAAKGVQPVLGAMLSIRRPGRPDDVPPVYDWLPLFVQDEAGYSNLCALVSAAHLKRPAHEPPHVPIEALAGRSDGLIALTGGGEGAVARLIAEGQAHAAAEYLLQLQSLFPGRLYLELSRRGDAVEEAAEAALIDLAFERDVPLVATNPVQYGAPDFQPAHDAMLCIAASAALESDERPRSSSEAWLKPEPAMVELFADLPEAVANTLVVAQRCAFAAPERKAILPRFASEEEEQAQLRRDAEAGLAARLARIPDADPAAYAARLAFELDVICPMGFAGYFLIVADFIKWAKSQGIAVGPGRGSGAGSVVAWALTITDLDPIENGLLFERFLNPERVSMPDFDIDFCETRREEVIRYVQARYGNDHVAQIITFGRMKARAVLKDVGRVLQMSYNHVDRLAKLVPNHPTDPWTLSRALAEVTELALEYERDEKVKTLLDLAMKLEGLPRHSSTHAAGVVIGDRPLDQLIPLYRDPRSDMAVTQFDMKYVEGAGLVKFDFLGLKTLSVLQRACDLIAGATGERPDLDALGLDDERVYALLQRGDTVGVFQLESEGMRRTLAAVKPTSFGDIVALVSLYRPGPMDNIPLFGDRKNGRAPVEYPHPLLEGILKETYGIFVYQEQVMQAAQILAGYTLGGADLLRRAMGKKIKSEMDAQRATFVSGCAQHHQIPEGKANELFDLIDKFAGYGFNKSHAAAYALLAYQTAWVKTHHPQAFFAASMAFDISNTDKLAVFADDMRRSGVLCLPPCINASSADFSVEQHNGILAVRYALGALKNVSEGAMFQLTQERAQGGPFGSIEDFANRINPRSINRRQIESLAGGGAFDVLESDRARVFAAAETILAVAASAEDARVSGQGGLFGEGGSAAHPIRLPQATVWAVADRMAAEKEAFGFYFSDHPVARYAHVAATHGARSFADVAAMSPAPDNARQGATMAALVENVRWRTSARGRRYVNCNLSDNSGAFMASAFDDEVAKQLEAMSQSGECALLTVELDRPSGEDTPRVLIRRAQRLEGMASNARTRTIVEIADGAGLPALAALLAGERGGRGELIAHVALPGGGEATLRLGRDFLIDATLVERIADIPGIVSARMEPLEAPKLALVS